mmetsp:Transcript_43817/g.85981  ORF Transcript_43817/g.85981 Transcript_43817/m.85981 type:complete len:213 (+) Transcript_43817:124-762(+)
MPDTPEILSLLRRTVVGLFPFAFGPAFVPRLPTGGLLLCCVPGVETAFSCPPSRRSCASSAGLFATLCSPDSEPIFCGVPSASVASLCPARSSRCCDPVDSSSGVPHSRGQGVFLRRCRPRFRSPIPCRLPLQRLPLDLLHRVLNRFRGLALCGFLLWRFRLDLLRRALNLRVHSRKNVGGDAASRGLCVAIHLAFVAAPLLFLVSTHRTRR